MTTPAERQVGHLARKLADAHTEAAFWQAHYDTATEQLAQVVDVLTDAQKRKLGLDA